MQTGWRVGSLFNIPLFIDNSWFFIVLFITLSQGGDPNRIELLGVGGAWAVGFIYAMLLFGSVLLHELGHSLVAQSQGITVNSIKLFLFGGVASIERESKTPGGAFKVAAAGPAVSIALFVLLTLLGNAGSLPPVANGLVREVAQVNLVLALFNLLPGLPLDGGQIFKAAVWKATNSRTTGVRWAAKSGQVVGWSGLLLGAIAFFSTGSLFAALWPVLIGLFILRNAGAYNRMNTLQEELAKLKTGDAAIRDFRVLDANMSLRQFADEYLLEDKTAPVYFASSDGRYRGMVTVEDLRQVERSEWEYRNLHSIARPLLEIPHVDENTPLTEAIQTLEDKQISRLTVLTPADAVAGTLDRGDIVRAVARALKLPITEPIIAKIKQDGVYPAGLQLGAIVQSIEKA
ncbi:site-2 protease family protein [cf. Phormidesmis sp. LEGE 11477]|uniref:site-2 protease family protein n=1 Tax=cf. Phormidesmis sp. LEGE 11477 TaxID=1828680 RepID=UPI001880FF1D|nr:site-2 protease family protein [cf. Phormidesmis sp. LEGE 11477]MBE9061566.1 site-2 protease family protein [cf. Phormidesmis sp. LEGE 11477]